MLGRDISWCLCSSCNSKVLSNSYDFPQYATHGQQSCFQSDRLSLSPYSAASPYDHAPAPLLTCSSRARASAC